MIITVTLNPALDKTICIPGFAVNTVNRVRTSRLDPGGKGINVSKSVHALGGKTLAISILGGAAGSYIKMALDKMGIRNDVVLTEAPTRTNLKIVDEVLGTNTDINEPGAALSEAELDSVWQKLSGAVQPGDTVVFAGKNPPGTPSDRIAQWMRCLKDRNVKLCVDTTGEAMRLALAERPDVIKPNLAELCEIVGCELQSEREILSAAKDLVAQGVGLVAASMGSRGALFAAKEQCLRVYTPKVSVKSTVGAGDSMMAALAYYSAIGCSLEETARRAAAVSAATVMSSGSEAAQLPAILPLIDRVRVERLL